jgi:hypothetical protein
MPYLHAKYDMPSPNSSLLIIIELATSEILQTAVMLWCILQKHVASTKVAYFSKGYYYISYLDPILSSPRVAPPPPPHYKLAHPPCCYRL